VQEEERHRISRELHDDIGQRIALAANEIDLVRREEPAGRQEHGSERLAKLHKELDAIATDIHKLSHELQSATLQCCGLRIALKDLCWKYSKNYNLEIELQAAELDAKLSPDVALCLFRVAQEALANVVKHGQTKKVRVATSQDAGRARLTVKDYGVGFDPAMDSGGIGLIGMRERVRFCGGLLSVKSAPDLGTEITAEVAVTKDTAAITND
jgi:signal transduction histidine kinase